MKDIYALFRHSLAGLRVLVAAVLVLGLVYPLLMTGVAHVLWPWRADGSLVTSTGAHTTDPSKAVGSVIIGQVTDDDALFYDRPSAAGDGYDMLDTYGTNLGPNDPTLVDSIDKLRQQIAQREGVTPAQVPADAVTSSGSGLDPDISPAYAQLQVPRVARANGLSEGVVRKLVDENTSGRTWGILGEAHVNVLMLNIAVKNAAQASVS